MLRRLELGHLPSERAVQLAVSLMRRAEKAASALEMMAPLMNSNDKLPPKALERGYREFFDCRSAFLAELMTQPEKERRSPETLAAITPESPNWWEEDQTKHGQSASGTS